MRTGLLIYVYLLVSTALNAQVGSAKDLQTIEDSIASTFRASIKAADDGEKLIINDQLSRRIEAALKQAGSWEFRFDSLKKFRILVEAPDKELRIYNWAIKMDDKSYRYFAYLQHYNRKRKLWEITKLEDHSDELKNIESIQLDEKKWFGVFYNTIIVTKAKKKKIYTLLGWDGNDRLTQKKLIETMTFNSIGKVSFGEPVLQVEKEISPGKKTIVNQRRVIFEYKQGVFMSLKWHAKEELIVFDHLGPNDSSKKGQFSDYGPTLALDGYKWEKGKWVLLKDPDAKNEQTVQDEKWNKPEEK